MKKIERHPTVVTSTPPTTGPKARETPTTAPQIPTAWARSRGMVNVFVMIDMATGFSMDPPTAWTMRKMTRVPRLGARLQRRDPTANVHSPMMKVRRRPKRSAVEPEIIRRLASTSVYASTVHWSPERDAWKSLPMEGRATLTIVTSMPTMSRLMQQMDRMPKRRRRLTTPGAAAAATGVSKTIIVIV